MDKSNLQKKIRFTARLGIRRNFGLKVLMRNVEGKMQEATVIAGGLAVRIVPWLGLTRSPVQISAPFFFRLGK